MLEGPGADSEEKREPVSDIDTRVVDSLKALDPDRPIREADMQRTGSCLLWANSGTSTFTDALFRASLTTDPSR